MINPYLQDKIENWVSDFCMSDGPRPFSPAVREVAGEVLVVFLSEACALRDIPPEEIEEADAKAGLMGKVAKFALPPEVRSEIPGVCGAFLAHLETEGRIAGGRALGAFVRALKETFVEAGSSKVKPIVSAGSKIGRNDPCPCGSGKKYKKCCQRDF